MEQFKGQSRLPKFAVPKRYDIRLKPDLISCKFAGSVNIDLDIVADTCFVVLNAADLSIRSGSVLFTSKNSSKVPHDLFNLCCCFLVYFLNCESLFDGVTGFWEISERNKKIRGGLMIFSSQFPWLNTILGFCSLIFLPFCRNKVSVVRWSGMSLL